MYSQTRIVKEAREKMSWRNVLGSMLAAAALAATVAAGPLYGVKTKAEIPFAFQVDGKKYDAGTYYFESTQWQGILSISDVDGHKRLLASTPLGYAGGLVDSRLSFTLTKAGWVLSEVWMNSNTGGYKMKSPAAASTENVQVSLLRR